MLLLAISIAALALGPVLYWVSNWSRPTTAALDGFVIVTISGLVVVHILPHSIAIGGLPVLGMAILGFLGPGLAEKWLHNAAAKAHAVTALFALVGLVVHAAADGMALAIPEEEGSVLALAVLLHRLPVALTVWWLLSSSRGNRAAVITLVIIAGATVLGYSAGDTVAPALDSEGFAFFQALVAGSLLHVVFHQPLLIRDEQASAESRAGAGLGALLGLTLVVSLADEHLPMQAIGSIDFAGTFLALLLETAPALILAFAFAGVVQAVMPQAPRHWLRAGGPGREAARGVVFGLPLPICSCGVVPLYSGLIRQGVPATAAMAFLVATPELGLDAVLISIPLLGTELTIIRVAAAFIVALLIGTIVGSLAKPTTDVVEAPPAEVRGSLRERIRKGLSFGFREIVDDTGPWILFGLVIAALAEPLLNEGWLQQVPWGVDVLIFAVLGIPLYVCASGATPLAAVLIHKGVSPGAAIAFLLAGPATNLTTFGILTRLHSRSIAMLFGGAIAVLAVGIGLVVNAISPDLSGLSLHASAEETHGIIAYGTAALLGLVYAASLLRIGPRGFVSQITDPFHSEHDHDDCESGSDHCHDH